jgi:pimeloyl-ACP methyl ester carboxylesterase
MSLEPRHLSVLCVNPAGLHRMAAVEWGDPHNPRVLICVHGLTRTGRDFDAVARDLSSHYRVVCPDVAGRGHSDWLPDPAMYVLPQYLADMVQLINRLNVDEVDWLGTSMGGLIGMALASATGTPVRRLLLNDVGPTLEAAALARIAEYVGRGETFDSFEQGVQYIRQVSNAFGKLSDEQWRALSQHTIVPRDGRWTLHYDPRIAQVFRDMNDGMRVESEKLLWAAWDRISCPTLVMRGEHSDLLSRSTLAAMQQRGPRAQVIEVPGTGHAPSLLDPEQIAQVRRWFIES